MAYTVNQLISGAYYASGVAAREFETVGGEQISEGLIWLNDIIGEKVVDKSMIPYEGTTTLNGVISQEAYSIDNLIAIDTITFVKDSVRYSLQYEKRNAYQGSNRTNNIDSLPYEWYFERGFGGGTLYLYFTPDQAYPLTIFGLFRLTEVALGQDLELTLDRFYRTYLRYELADRICTEYNYTVPPGTAEQIKKYRTWIAKKSRKIDLRMKKVSTLQNSGGINYGYVNLGRGWVTNTY